MRCKFTCSMPFSLENINLLSVNNQTPTNNSAPSSEQIYNVTFNVLANPIRL